MTETTRKALNQERSSLLMKVMRNFKSPYVNIKILKEGGKERKKTSFLLLAGLLAILISAQLAVNVRAHWTSHDNITEDTFKDEFTPEALKKIINANEGQDSGSNAADKKRHFDRNIGEGHGVAFKRGKDYILEELNEIKNRLKGSPSNDDINAALLAFGRLLHTLQDLTSHSNYINLSSDDQIKVLEAILNCTKDPPDSLQLTSYLTRTADIREKLQCDYRIDTPSHGKDGLDDDTNAVFAAKNLSNWMEDVLEKQIGKDKKDLMRNWKPPVRTPVRYPRSPWQKQYMWEPDPTAPILTTDGYLPLSIAIPVANQFGLPLFISQQGKFNEDILKQIIELKPKFVTMIGENDTVLPFYKKNFDAYEIMNVFFKGDYQNMSIGIYNLFNDERMTQIPMICDTSHPILSKDTTPIYVSNITNILKLLDEYRIRNTAVISNYGTAKALAEAAAHFHPEIITYDVTQNASEVYAFIDSVKKSAQNSYVSPQILQELVDSYLHPIDYITIPKIVDTCPLPGSIGISVPTNIEIAFNKPMNQISTQQAVSIYPSVYFGFSWFENVLVITPTKLDGDTVYTLTIETTAEDSAGNHLTTPTQITFTTTNQLQLHIKDLELELNATRLELNKASENLKNLISNYEALEIEYTKTKRELESVKVELTTWRWSILVSTIAAFAIGYSLSMVYLKKPKKPRVCGRRSPEWTCTKCGRRNGGLRATCPSCGEQRPAWVCSCHNFQNPAGTVRCGCQQH